MQASLAVLLLLFLLDFFVFLDKTSFDPFSLDRFLDLIRSLVHLLFLVVDVHHLLGHVPHRHQTRAHLHRRPHRCLCLRFLAALRRRARSSFSTWSLLVSGILYCSLLINLTHRHLLKKHSSSSSFLCEDLCGTGRQNTNSKNQRRGPRGKTPNFHLSRDLSEAHSLVRRKAEILLFSSPQRDKNRRKKGEILCRTF